MTHSQHLDEIISRHNNVANLQVLFVDIEKYSKRRTQNQVAVVAAFTECLRGAIQAISGEFVQYSQDNNVNFATDIVKVPTGDGALIVFSFDGLHDLHLRAALELLKRVSDHNSAAVCDRFNANGWCNCHTHFNVRVGLDEGRGVIYRDLNHAYNVAGGVVNLASRVMGLVDGQQIAVTDRAHAQLVDLVEDVSLGDQFRAYPDVRVKHDETVTVHVYTNDAITYLNPEEPSGLHLQAEMQSVVQAMAEASLPMPDLANLDRKTMLNNIKTMASAMGAMNGAFLNLSADEEATDADD